MSLLEAILMGLIQGITEFLPVSSSGHLALFQIAFDLEETGLLFDCLLHFGTLIAVFAVYFRDIWKMICEGFGIIGDFFINVGTAVAKLAGRKEQKYRRVICNGYRKFVMLVIVSTIPTGIIGVTASDLIEQASTILLVPGICLIITSVLLFIADRCKEGNKTPRHVSYTNAFIIGICQGFATLPGISRSGTTITACLLSGFDRKFAVKYSFIMSIPAILGSVVLQLIDLESVSEISSGEWTNYLVGTLVAAVVGYICIKIMLYVVRQKKYTIFSIYCLIVGIISISTYFVLA
ncbi:MAG: undecaprenyl-diphosphate phosphatase [Eubacterium sp.]|jgi:undecaprenyl-diphosphatase|nr:undecaprenyl-diphosphate phosphatase [Eubacterium sp.]